MIYQYLWTHPHLMYMRALQSRCYVFLQLESMALLKHNTIFGQLKGLPCCPALRVIVKYLQFSGRCFWAALRSSRRCTWGKLYRYQFMLEGPELARVSQMEVYG